MSAPGPRVVVIGVGNPYRRDDGVGPAVVDRLRRSAPAGVRLEESDGEPSQLLVLLTFAGEVVTPWDWLLLHTGLAVARISATEAAEVNAIRHQGDVHA